MTWDQVLTGELKGKWINYMKTLVECKGIKFRRSIKPPEAIGKMWLVCFWDGANPASSSKSCR